MKKTALLLLQFFCLMVSTSGQDLITKFGSPVKGGEKVVLNIIGQYSEGFFVLSERKETYRIEKFDTQLNLEKTVKLSLKVKDKDYGKKALTFKTCILIETGPIVFAYARLQKQGKYALYAQNYDFNLNPVSNWTRISDDITFYLFIKLSNDQSKVLIASFSPVNNFDYFNVKFTDADFMVFENNLKPIIKYKIPLSNWKTETELIDFKIDNTGEIYALFKIKEKETYEYALLNYYYNEDDRLQTKEYNLKIKNYEIRHIHLALSNHDEPFVTGFCAAPKENSKRAFFFTFDPEHNEANLKITEVKSNYYHFFKNGESTQQEHSDDLSEFTAMWQLQNFIFLDDGSYMLVGEHQNDYAINSMKRDYSRTYILLFSLYSGR